MFFSFNGLFAPHWRSDARGTIVGLTQYTQREHICRATLEAVAFQVYEILLAMEKDSGQQLKALLVDGGMTKNELLMQTQADFNGSCRRKYMKRKSFFFMHLCTLLGISVIQPKMAETTSLGAALAAAFTVGLWSMEQETLQDSESRVVFETKMDSAVRDAKFQRWSQAIERSLNWEKN